MKICKHNDGMGHCSISDDCYCVEGPCSHEELVEYEPAKRWIPVEDGLPDPFVSVLVRMPGEKPMPTVREGYVSNSGAEPVWVAAGFRREQGEVTHWMQMPNFPGDVAYYMEG